MSMWGWIVASAAMSALGTWLARGYALRRRLIDEPGERRSHTVSTPRGGGIGLVVACAAVVAVLGTRAELTGVDWRWLLAAFLPVAIVGGLDDHRPVDARIRLLVHLLAGVALAIAFGYGGEPVAVIVVALAVAVLVNVWNFMDGINGLAATQALLVVGTAALLLKSPWVVPGVAFGAAVAAFVPFNFPRARIFLGDVGSGALGVLIAVVGLALATQRAEHEALLILFPCAAFLVDASLTLGWRVVEGERWWTPHTRHLYQGLARRHGHARVTGAYSVWSGIGAAIALLLEGRPSVFIMASLILWYMAAGLLWAGLQYRITRRSAVA